MHYGQAESPWTVLWFFTTHELGECTILSCPQLRASLCLHSRFRFMSGSSNAVSCARTSRAAFTVQWRVFRVASGTVSSGPAGECADCGSGALKRIHMGCVLPAALGRAPAWPPPLAAGLPSLVEATTINSRGLGGRSVAEGRYGDRLVEGLREPRLGRRCVVMQEVPACLVR